MSFKKKNRNSIKIFPLNTGGSNASKIELDAIFTPPYNAARFGITVTTDPYQADIVLVYGVGTAKAAPAVQRLLWSLPQDVLFVLLGSESISGAPFQAAYAVTGPITELAENQKEKESYLSPLNSKIIRLPAGKKISAYIPGSPPDPQTILDGILSIAIN